MGGGTKNFEWAGVILGFSEWGGAQNWKWGGVFWGGVLEVGGRPNFQVGGRGGGAPNFLFFSKNYQILHNLK